MPDERPRYAVRHHYRFGFVVLDTRTGDTIAVYGKRSLAENAAERHSKIARLTDPR